MRQLRLDLQVVAEEHHYYDSQEERRRLPYLTVKEMRPISVLQEFSKIASKILADRLGQILLKHDEILNRAQRAFLKNGCINQCINTALNVFEDFKVKQKKNPKALLFAISYDQEKAYDSVQKYTIRASQERFNLPESFIR